MGMSCVARRLPSRNHALRWLFTPLHSRGSTPPRFWWLHIGGLWALVVAQPLLDLIARNTELLIAHQLTRSGDPGAQRRSRRAGPSAADRSGRRHRRGRREGPGAGCRRHGRHPRRAGGDAGRDRLRSPRRRRDSDRLPVRSRWRDRVSAAGVGSGICVRPCDRRHRGAPRLLFATGHLAHAVAAARRVRGEPRRASHVERCPGCHMVFDEISLVTLLDSDAAIDASHFPNLADLAGDGIWFRNATTVSDYTRWALPAIVSGMRPRPDASSSARDHPNSIFSLLARRMRSSRSSRSPTSAPITSAVARTCRSAPGLRRSRRTCSSCTSTSCSRKSSRGTFQTSRRTGRTSRRPSSMTQRRAGTPEGASQAPATCAVSRCAPRGHQPFRRTDRAARPDASRSVFRS